MDKLWWRAAWGLCLVQLSLAQLQIDLNITCRYAGVFHVEKNGRYSISRTEAPDLCKAFNSTLPTMAQMQQALAMGFETCRYGFIQGHVVIPRIHPNAICAANNTGVYILTSNTSHYDTYCFNASAPLDEEDCTSVTDLPNSFDGKVTITIVNRDGTRYSKKGAEYRTHEEDINPSQPIDEDMSSGSSSERSTSGGYTIFHTHLPTSQPSTDQEDAGASENNPTTNVDSSHSTTLQPPVDPNTDSVEDVNGTGPISVTTQHSHSQSFSTSHGELEEDKEQTTVSTITSGNRNDGRGGRRGGNPPEDSTTSLEGKTSHYPDTRENRTLMPVTPAQPGVFGVTEVPVGDFTSNVDGSLPGDQDAGGRSHTTHGSGSAGHSSGSQEGGATTTSGPIRKPHIPEWLIILASLLALALILAVCIAVNSRRRCGQKKKLVINNGNGTVDDRKPSGLNGEASKSQEMVHLVNKESSETPDQFMTADETRNLQNVDMKIGV
ncbi:CD44 antigen isoform X8 [Ictidomys tridecemlineatus]|uniref:CD44 antigen isoform X10 n=1 Tax=Ictidomys tridecemlineatus TaxID=43179 RepID=UPI000682B902|nr:CD44 antigen isoform X10 [Ictidomys tridecemlineatus]KAG3285469.1 CD44 molecule (Indian blood group), transcript variant X6 [Ictidomys tridecemlineatus]